ncbi:FAD-binding oxidoreductase [Elioraea rosea]|uniref:FAD-binding oxidoreductase n=1 Tax=Elioraea rosea TaxID=2492390 RepID=UPI001185C476|nr:FAD-binding oxidoreductase [Elioraea rosea]
MHETLSPRIEALLAELPGIEAETDPVLVRLKSRDFYWYSPVLKPQLDGKRGEVVIRPRDEAQVLEVLAACVRHRIPVVPRGGGTGNYGQAVPLEGGVILDMTAMEKILSFEGGITEVEAGATLMQVDAWARQQGWELRLWPSTKRTATVGGFVGGGGAGVGGIAHGTLREPGNLAGVTIATMEDRPRLQELAWGKAAAVNHCFGTTGVITRVRLPLAPAMAWRDIAVSFADFASAAAFGLALGMADGIAKKMCAVIDWPLPSFFKGLAELLPEGRPVVLAMVAPCAMGAVADLVAAHGGEIEAEQDFAAAEAAAELTPFYEFTWNHTTLQVLKRDKGVTYLQCLFPAGRTLETVAAIRDRFVDELWMHTEVARFGGQVTMSALPVVRWTTRERLWEIIAACEAEGVAVANPHVYTLEEGARWKLVGADRLAFKHAVDPHGLLNPGKMTSFTPRAGQEAAE